MSQKRDKWKDESGQWKREITFNFTLSYFHWRSAAVPYGESQGTIKRAVPPPVKVRAPQKINTQPKAVTDIIAQLDGLGKRKFKEAVL